MKKFVEAIDDWETGKKYKVYAVKATNKGFDFEIVGPDRTLVGKFNSRVRVLDISKEVPADVVKFIKKSIIQYSRLKPLAKVASKMKRTSSKLRLRKAAISSAVLHPRYSNSDFNYFRVDDTVGLSGHVANFQIFDIVATGKVVNVDEKAHKVNVAWFQRDGVKQHDPEEIVLLWRGGHGGAATMTKDSTGEMMTMASKRRR